jgi:6-phosphogluconolactonase
MEVTVEHSGIRATPLVTTTLVLLALALACVPAAALAAGSAYVTNLGSPSASSSDVSQYSIGGQGQLSPLTPATVAAGRFPNGVAVTPDGRSVYVSNGNGDTVNQYDVDPMTGALSPKTPATVATGSQASGVAVAPDGKSAYVVAYDDKAVFQYDVDPVSGALSPKTPATVATGTGPGDIAVAPDGKSAYVTDASSNEVSQYDLDPTSGALSPKTPATVPTGLSTGAPQSVAVAPDSKSAYVSVACCPTTDFVSQFDIDPTTGALSPKSPAMVATGAGASDIAVTPDGKSAYVGAQGNGATSERRVWQYDINPLNGKLSSKTPATIDMPDQPYGGIAVSFDSRSAYVIQFNGVAQLNIDPANGTLSFKSPATVPAGLQPSDVVVGPLPEGNYPHPRGATPFKTYLVPAYQRCVAWNRMHGPPFQNYGSCAPPRQASSYLTVGTPDSNERGAKSLGVVLMRVFSCPACAGPGPNADVRFDVAITDVRKKSDLSDYTGELQADAALRITDQNNTPNPGPGPGTVSDTHFPFAFPCTATSDTTVGSTCSVSTSANAVVPNSVVGGQRAIWQLGQVQVFDGGADGVASTTGDNTLYMDQGIFVP